MIYLNLGISLFIFSFSAGLDNETDVADIQKFQELFISVHTDFRVR